MGVNGNLSMYGNEESGSIPLPPAIDKCSAHKISFTHRFFTYAHELKPTGEDDIMDANPKQVKKALDKHVDDRHSRDLERIRQEGYREGRRRGHADAIDFLQARYLEADNRPDRNSNQAKAMLNLARELSTHLKELEMPKLRRPRKKVSDTPPKRR